MSIVNRVKNICFAPSTEWPVIAANPVNLVNFKEQIPPGCAGP